MFFSVSAPTYILNTSEHQHVRKYLGVTRAQRRLEFSRQVVAVHLPGQFPQLRPHRVHEAGDKVTLPQCQELLKGLFLFVLLLILWVVGWWSPPPHMHLRTTQHKKAYPQVRHELVLAQDQATETGVDHLRDPVHHLFHFI